jgi:hypothetical protein
MKRPRLIEKETQRLDYLQKDISLCFDCAQHGALNVWERTLSDEDISAPLNVRKRTLSGAEGYTSKHGTKVNVKLNHTHMNPIKNLIIILLSISALALTGQNNALTSFSLTLEAGKHHNHPTFAVWLETIDGQFVQPLFVTKSLATGTYPNADAGDKRWKREPGEARRPATLPYFLHKRGVKAPDGTYLPTPQNPIADAYTGATPLKSATLTLSVDKKLAGKYKILLEVNQPWDFNAVWFNDRIPESSDYLTSAQPSLVYMVEIDTENLHEEYFLNPIGHGDPTGATAREIFSTIKLRMK